MHSKFFAASVLMVAMATGQAWAQDGDKVSVHGSIQSDILVPQEDNKIGTGTYKEDVLTNTYADINIAYKSLEVGTRLEFTEYPLPGFEPDFKGWGVPYLYAKFKTGKGVDVTLGDFYDQFGSGLIFRTYEERSLGIDNSIRGAHVAVNAIKGVQFKALGGVQRRYWDWDTDSWLAGADLEINIDQYSKRMQENNISWMVGGSYVLLNYEEDGDNIIVPGTNFRLDMPSTVHAFDVRSRLQTGNYSFLAEYAWRSQDPSADNGYIYRRGSAVLLSASYSAKGVSALFQAKRSENMSFRSRRSVTGTSAFVNNMPAFAYQHTYSLPALYPYATQAAPGEWAFQGEFGYTFRRNSALGGKYGTKLKLNVSHIRGLDKDLVEPIYGNTLMGTDGYETGFFKMGKLYYQDINLQMEKKLSKSFKLNLMYMNQRYDKTVIEGEGGVIKANIGVAEGKYQINKKFTLRGELQYLSTSQDQGDWAFGLLELSALPYLMFTVSDMWNTGETDIHYYMASVTGTYKAHRLMLGYGRTRAGYNCSGGVCRYVPASKGLNISYNYTF